MPHYQESFPLHVLSVLMLHLCPRTSVHHNPCPSVMKMSLIIFLAERPAICHSFLRALPLSIHWMKSGWMNESTMAFSVITLPVSHLQTRNKIFLCISDVPIIPPPSSSDRFSLSLSNHPILPLLFRAFYIQNSIPSLSLSLPWTLLWWAGFSVLHLWHDTQNCVHFPSVVLWPENRQHCLWFPSWSKHAVSRTSLSSHATEYSFSFLGPYII